MTVDTIVTAVTIIVTAAVGIGSFKARLSHLEAQVVTLTQRLDSIHADLVRYAASRKR